MITGTSQSDSDSESFDPTGGVDWLESLRVKILIVAALRTLQQRKSAEAKTQGALDAARAAAAGFAAENAALRARVALLEPGSALNQGVGSLGGPERWELVREMLKNGEHHPSLIPAVLTPIQNALTGLSNTNSMDNMSWNHSSELKWAVNYGLEHLVRRSGTAEAGSSPELVHSLEEIVNSVCATFTTRTSQLSEVDFMTATIRAIVSGCVGAQSGELGAEMAQTTGKALWSGLRTAKSELLKDLHASHYESAQRRYEALGWLLWIGGGLARGVVGDVVWAQFFDSVWADFPREYSSLLCPMIKDTVPIVPS